MEQTQKRPSSFDYEDMCFVCQNHKKNPNSKYRTNIHVIDVDIQTINDQYKLWKNKSEYPEKIGTVISVLDDALVTMTSLASNGIEIVGLNVVDIP